MAIITVIMVTVMVTVMVRTCGGFEALRATAAHHGRAVDTLSAAAAAAELHQRLLFIMTRVRQNSFVRRFVRVYGCVAI